MNATSTQQYFDAQIAYIIDGDTVEAELQARTVLLESVSTHHITTRVRLVGLDAYPKNSDKGQSATKYVQNWVNERASITLELCDPERPRDKYGRVLAYLRADDRVRSLNEELVIADLVLPWNGKGERPAGNSGVPVFRPDTWEQRLRELVDDRDRMRLAHTIDRTNGKFVIRAIEEYV